MVNDGFPAIAPYGFERVDANQRNRGQVHVVRIATEIRVAREFGFFFRKHASN